MEESVGNFLVQEDVKKEITSRSKTYIEKSISHSKPESLEILLKLEQQEGWEVLRKNQKSFRLKKPKPLDEQLEDEAWCLMARMGFQDLSDGRQFKIAAGDGLEPRQIDVFAKDDECALFIECTQCESPKKKDMSSLINKINSINGPIRQSVIKYYGKLHKLKMRWIIVTRNIEWGKADLGKAKDAQIVVIQEHELEYFKKLTQHIKTAARYQLLAHVFSGEVIKGLNTKVLATRGTMGGHSFYNFLMSPKELLKIGYISHKASREIDNIETYQRMLKPARLKDIARYIDEGGQFPTNIVINVKTKKKQHIQFDKKEDIGDVSVGLLTLPSTYSCAWIIDGQHRLYGYSYSKRSEITDDKTTFPVLAYINMPPIEEAKMFVDINCEQVKVQKSLLIEIYATLNWGSEDRAEQIEAIRSRLSSVLDKSPSSPIQGRIISSASPKSGLRCLTAASFSDGLHENKFFGDITASNDFTPGPLWASYAKEDDVLDETLEKAKDVISGYLGFFARDARDHWNLGSSPGGFLATNLGLRTLFRVLKSLIVYSEKDVGLNLHGLEADTILGQIEEFTKPVSKYFKSATKEKVAPFRRQSSLAGVKDNSLGLMYFIREEFPNFNPSGLQEYIDSRDEEGTRESQGLVTEIQKMISEFVIFKLKEHYGEKDKLWWYDGVDLNIRTECMKEREKINGKGEPENYFYLIDYMKIAEKNWAKIFQHPFSYYKEGNKLNRLKWIKELTEIRNQTSHPERGVLTTDQVDFVRKLHAYALENFRTDKSENEQ